LAAQIGESFRVYGQHTSLRHTVIFGGVKQGPQTLALHRGVDILVATPGRLLDLLNQRLLSLRGVEILVLDEADRMLDMGFIYDIRRVLAQLPARRQTLMFSATIPREIRTLAATLLHDPVHVKVEAESPAADTVQQALYFVEPQDKVALLEHLLRGPEMTRTLVFTRTKHGADKVVRQLCRSGIDAEAIHSNKSQNARMRALANFKAGKTRVLVASDIAARGLDVDNISHVFNYDLPNVAETYVHRIGRTGRAGATGQAISFCSQEQRDDLREIERLLGKQIPVLHHSIKGQTPPATVGSPHARVAARNDQGAGAPQSSPSPQQQKDAFWRSRRPASSGRRWGRSRFTRRGR
jgi:ATP-dependent RNA helicase RhlE